VTANDANWHLGVTEFVQQVGMNYLCTVIFRHSVELPIVKVVMSALNGSQMACSPLTGHAFA
jgi:hypothetical protein